MISKSYEENYKKNYAGFDLRLEQILARELDLGHHHINFIGSASVSTLALLLSNTTSASLSLLPHLVVVPHMADAARFAQSLSFFRPDIKPTVLPHFDVSPYSGLYPKPLAIAERVAFLFKAHNAKPGQVFIAPIGSLLQKTLPFKDLANHTYKITVDYDLPAHFNQLLQRLGYSSAPLAEDVGQYSARGGILDIFSPAHKFPIRIELFGDTVSSLRWFDPQNQQSLSLESPSSASPLTFFLIPCRETIWPAEHSDALVNKFKHSLEGRTVDRSEVEEALRSLSRSTPFDGVDFLLPFFFDELASPIDHFSSALNLWFLDPQEIDRRADLVLEEIKADYDSSLKHLIRPPMNQVYTSSDKLPWPESSPCFEFSNIDTQETLLGSTTAPVEKIAYRTSPVFELSNALNSLAPGGQAWLTTLDSKLKQWRTEGYRIFIGVKSKSQADRLFHFLDKLSWLARPVGAADYLWNQWAAEQDADQNLIHIIQRVLPESVRIHEDRFIFLKEEDLLGKKIRQAESSSRRASEEFQKQASRLSFGDLKPGDCIVHIQHGIGVYDGLKVMNIHGYESEFLQIHYKDKDRLYLPVYRVGQIQKYSGAVQTTILDKLGGTGWEKTKSKVRNHLRDMASELLRLYAKRAEARRPAFPIDEDAFASFESAFPYDETDDQLRAIQEIVKDLSGTKPMDRLICGDVGFGKTEVAMRAAFLVAHAGFQVAVLAPTTVLTFQHFETFKKRFAGWNYEIRELNRFASPEDVKKTIKDLREGRVQIVIGTHRLLSRDIQFKNLGLLVVDEEQKFGVTHKEKVRKMREEIDTLTLSATPIPRTLNMSLVGIRDLSLINTAPVDRLPTRTFICKWDEETIRRSIQNEIKRGGQVYFIHNRVQSIYSLVDELKKIVPEARIKVGHGQMDEASLENTMVQFFNHEIDVLVCTTIVESGMDVSRANTMFIDQAHMMGLSQLYQLRGRVGRSKQRAYCYLLLPRNKRIEKDAQERLKVIQENTALGSGIRIAQYDLELRGAGDLLGEEQSGHIDSVGYELYMELLDEAVHQLRGEPIEDRSLEPEINLKVQALIPDSYISDLRLRLSYYKALADINSHEDLEQIELELRDQFGEPPPPVQNLMGLMLIRSQCKVLGVRDLSSGLKNISLIFTEKTRLKPETVIGLAMRENKKYSITPDNRLNIRMNTITWPAVHEELNYLLKL